jgi:hypothetical protein
LESLAIHSANIAAGLTSENRNWPRQQSEEAQV